MEKSEKMKTTGAEEEKDPVVFDVAVILIEYTPGRVAAHENVMNAKPGGYVFRAVGTCMLWPVPVGETQSRL